ncbi:MULTISPECIES: LptF/LptG family permease [Alistipes]|jgi:lipopolysaccharide export system permease protein|uniref:LptF/LptG family permease n=1 Tax=Alistipes TaxID=239759 RepID=UPI000E49C95F|nr:MULTISPECIES: LptF/LptG family permease [Alistipes]MBS1413947.1 YjgP/YjgQ family permease [Alistipes sp.]MDO5384440.1 LptF/LptG family permease [Rikenellaceae bacterium]RHR67846.1 YjgP/YjgQ family permease [Alistipes sp. AF17-16]
MKFPGIKIIDRYIIRKFLGTYFFAIALIIVVVVIFDAAEKIDDFIELKAPLSKIVLQYYLNFIPFFINQFSGLFTFIAVIFFTSKMAYQTEIIAILSAGISFRRLMWPYILSAGAITLLSLVLNLVVIPAANGERLKFELNYIKNIKGAKYDPHIYRQIEPGTFAYIRDYTEQTRTAAFFVLETYENGTIVSSLEAANAKFDPETGRWSAPKSVYRKFEDDKEIFNNTQALDTLINLNTSELGRVEELVKTMDIVTLGHFIQQQRAKGSDMIARFEVERHNRFAFPASTFILTIIGVSLSSRKVRGGTGLHIGIGIVLAFSFILFSKFGEEFAKGGLLPPGIAVWIPNIIYSFIAFYLYKKAPK